MSEAREFDSRRLTTIRKAIKQPKIVAIPIPFPLILEPSGRFMLKPLSLYPLSFSFIPLSLSLSLSKGSFSLIHIYQVENCDDKDQVLLVLVSFFFMKNKKRIIRRKNNNALLGQRGWLKMTSLTTNKAHSKVQ
jgi:hypothetical protein